MIDRIIHFSIHNKLIVGLFVMGLIAWGSYAMTDIPIDAVPDITDNQIQVITTSPSLAAQEVEKFITYPLEMELGNIPNVLEVRSISRFGLSVITVVFEEEMDIYLARQLVGERIQSAKNQIPEGLGDPGMGPISTGLGEIYQYVLYPAEGYEEEYGPMELRAIQDWIVKRQLTGIDGVIEVNSSGGYLKQYEIAIDPDQLKSMGLSLEDVFLALSKNNENTGGSYIEKEHYTYFIRGEGLLKNIQDLELVPVKKVNGFPILIKDIARVQFGHAPRFGAVTMNGKGEVVAGQVMMLKGENAATVTRRVKARMKQIEQSLPEGVKIEPYLDRTKLVNRTIQTVLTNLIEGGLIVIFVLVLLMGNLRAGLLVASVIPLSMLFAIGMMRFFGVSANLMSLGAIDFGLIVDGAVIIVESILHHLSKGKISIQNSGEVDMDAEVFKAASQTRKSAAFGEIIILIVYLPILFLTGIEGKMFIPMAQTVSFAIMGALILSLTYVPMMSALMLSIKPAKQTGLSDRIIQKLLSLYQPILKSVMRIKPLILGLTVGLFLFSLWGFSRMGGEFIPTLEEGDFALHQILPSGSSLAEGVAVSAELQNILLDKFPEVEKVVTKIGTSEIPFDIMPMEAGDIFVILKPKSQWVSAKNREELFEIMEAEMNQFPGVGYEFTQPIQMRFNELMTGIRQDIAIKIYGEDLGILAQKAQEAQQIIQQIEGVGDIKVEPTTGLQQMVIHYDRAKIAKHGLDITSINRLVRGSFAGEKAGYMFEGQRRFDLVVRLEKELRSDIEHLRQLYIPLDNGQQIPLNELAAVQFEEGPTQISRDNTQRRITIGVNARNRDIESLVDDIERQLSQRLSLPAGYYIRYGGQFENLQRAQNRLSIVVPMALGLIFILLYLTFQSISQALLIFTAIPMSAIGGIWALYLRGMPFSISAGIGFIALFGVAVLNGIVLIASFNQLKRAGMTDLRSRILEGTQQRFRPVIMTAAVASLGFLPMAISSAAGAEVQQPLATVVIGGLITATFLTLIIIPILYHYSQQKYRILPGFKRPGIFILMVMLSPMLFSQSRTISLAEAQMLAKSQHTQIEHQQLKASAQQARIQAAGLQPRANLYISGEETGFQDQPGVQSIGFLQNIYLPGYTRAQRAVQAQKYQQSVQSIELSEKAIEMEVALQYYNWVYCLLQLEQLAEIQKKVEQFKSHTESRFAAGDLGGLAVLEAQQQLKEIELMRLNVSQALAEIRNSFHYWVGADSLFRIDTTGFRRVSLPLTVADSQRHAFLSYQETALRQAEAQILFEEKKLQPQLQIGAQFQRINGQIPFYGYQLGLNVPLFRKSYQAGIEAAKIERSASARQLELQEQHVALQQIQSTEQMKFAYEKCLYIKKEMLPDVNKQIDWAWEAFTLGEINHSDFMEILERGFQVKQQFQESLLDFYLHQTEWMYWH